MNRGGRRVALQAILWAGPLGLGLAIVVLVASAPFFHHGPETPSAGDPRAWTAIWATLAVLALGSAIGSMASATWLALALRGGRRPRGLEWFRTVLNLLMGLGFVLLWNWR